MGPFTIWNESFLCSYLFDDRCFSWLPKWSRNASQFTTSRNFRLLFFVPYLSLSRRLDAIYDNFFTLTSTLLYTRDVSCSCTFVAMICCLGRHAAMCGGNKRSGAFNA